MNKIYYNQGFPTNNSKETYCVSIDGNQIHNEEELLNQLKSVYDMPDANNWDAAKDWLEDLSWLNYKSHILIITDYSKFMENDFSSKQIFLRILQDTVEGWDGDVEKDVGEGRKQSFNAGLVD